MKKIKIMLLSLFVLAAVGGVLAFKTRVQNFCHYSIVGTTCPMINIASTLTLDPLGLPKSQTTIFNDGNCPTTVPTLDCKFSYIKTKVE